MYMCRVEDRIFDFKVDNIPSLTLYTVVILGICNFLRFSIIILN